MIRALIFCSLLIFSSAKAKSSIINYSQAGDVYHQMLWLSKQPKHSSLFKAKPLSSLEVKSLTDFKRITSKYDTDPRSFSPLFLAFFKSNSVDGALRRAKKKINSTELADLVSALKALKPRVSKYIIESQNFKSNAVLIEKKLKKDKVYKTFKDSIKFFQLAKSMTPKIYLLWAPKGVKQEISFKQNIVFVKIHPLGNLQELIDEDFVLTNLAHALFKALPKSSLENFEKIVFPSCPKEGFYKKLSSVIGPIHHQFKIKKKKFDPFIYPFKSKSDNIFSLLAHFYYESQLKKKSKFHGDFANGLGQLCKQVY